ncbi:MAG: TonB-dependent receptor [Muribaculum sp.]
MKNIYVSVIRGTMLLVVVFAWAHVYGSGLPVDSIKYRRTLDEVFVTERKSSVGLMPQTVMEIDRDMIDNSTQPSLLPLLTSQVPGVFTTSRGVYGYGVSGGAAGGISVRGMSGGTGRIMTLIDGHPQYSGVFGHPVSDALQSSIAESVEIVRGPASAIYGSNAMGGVINIVTRRPSADGVYTSLSAGYGSYNTLYTEAANQLKKGRFLSTASVSYNRSDNNRDDMDFSQVNGYVKLGYDISKHWSARTDFDITRFSASNPGAVTSPLLDADQSVTRGMVAVAVDNEYGNTSGGASMFFNFGHNHINDGYAPSASPRPYRFISDDNMGGLSLWQAVSPFYGNTLTVGVDLFRSSGKAWNKYVDGERKGEWQVLADKWHSTMGAYINVRQRLGGRLMLNGAIRADRHSSVGTEWIPQIGSEITLPRDLVVKLSAAKGFRYPTLKEMYMFGPANPDLKPESSWNYEISLAQPLFGGRLDYSINIFYLNAENLIVTVPREGATPLNVNTGKVENYGAEATLYYRINREWSVDANYGYLHTSRPLLEAPRHKLCVNGRFVKKRFDISSGIQYVAGLYTLIDSHDTENFLLWNLCGRYEVMRWMKLWVRCDNLLAQKYEINAGYPMPRMTVMAGIKLDF